MLRVICERQGTSHRIDLHGTLGGDWVAILEQVWRAIRVDMPHATVTVSLANVDFIDPEG